ncbi:GEVED domain-containing protein [Desulfobacula sp.]|uniref:GEVED domain-containing protein n=1 Tax=Desulfobacula sp. TaxID=2593537 RepID=UPI00262C9F1A|nr:GEVED domain-containing protein [Desulfobacula sp.]
MKNQIFQKAGMFIIGIIVMILSFGSIISAGLDDDTTYFPRKPPASIKLKAPSALIVPKVSSAPGYCASNGGSHLYEYIEDVQYTRLTEDTISITVEIYIANPDACESGEECPQYDDSPEHVNGWIDWNGDQVFEESERVLNIDLTGYLGINYSGTMSTSTIVSIPEDAVDTTYMRVNLGWDHDPNDPCELNWTWGDIVDRVVSPRMEVPIISDITVTGIPDANNPMTSDTSLAGVEKVRLEAVITPADGYAVTNISWSGDIMAGDGNPYEYVPASGTHGMKYVMCAITYEDTSTSETWTDIRGRNFKLFFNKTGDDDGDSEPNWFEYWTLDSAVPNINQFLYDPTATWYGCYCSGSLYLGSSAAGQHYGSAITLTTHFGTESFGGPSVKGVDSAAEIIGHELYHLWVRDQWQSGGDFHGEDDSDEGVPCTSCDDNLPDGYETNTSHTDPDDKTDTYDLEHKKHSDYERYGDNEYMAMRAGDGSRGIAIRDWANPGKQSDPPYGCHSLGDFGPVEAHLTGYFTDTGVDEDGDSLYDHLRIQAELDVGVGVIFKVLARLLDHGSNEISWVRKDFILYSGTHLIALDFDGETIRKSGISGPYTVSFVINDDEGMDVDAATLAHETAAYGYLDFEQQDAAFTGANTDEGVDTNANGVFDTLRIKVGVNVKTPKSYIVEGALYDNLGKAIEVVNVDVFLGEGLQTIDLDFDAHAIRRNRVAGPYFLKYLSISGSPQVDFLLDAYTTGAYGISEFEKAGAGFSDTYSDSGQDTDSDSLYNTLDVAVNLDVQTVGAYSLTGWLYDADGKIVQKTTSADLGAGAQTMILAFEGTSIYLNGENGPYYLKYLTLYNSSGELMDTINDAYTTTAYDYTDFQRPLIGLTGSYVDSGVDSDADGKYDKLVVDIGVFLSDSGYCVAKARLTDEDQKEIAWAEKIVQFESDGAGTIQLEFDGDAIYNNSVDGPYILNDIYIYHVGDPTRPAYRHEAYTTAAYAYCDFGPCPPKADAGPDRTEPVGTACLAAVTLDGSGSDDPDGGLGLTYTWTWSVGGEAFSSEGMAPVIELPLGIHTITLVVNNGIMNSEPDFIEITVIDSTSPTISVSATPDVLWPPNHKMVAVSLAVTVQDNCDPAPTIILTSVVSSEPDETPSGGDGHTSNDIQGAEIGTADYEIYLRSERNGKGSGRTYLVDYMVIDSSGNTATSSVEVRVPHNK